MDTSTDRLWPKAEVQIGASNGRRLLQTRRLAVDLDFILRRAAFVFSVYW
jgi:hypothetical protein